MVVGIVALFAGNLIARGQIRELLGFVVFFLLFSVFQWPILFAKSAAVLLVCYFLKSWHTDGLSLEWADTWRC